MIRLELNTKSVLLLFLHLMLFIHSVVTTRHRHHRQHVETHDKKDENVTVKVGQQATLPCFVSQSGFYKVIWSRNGDILTLGSTKINSDARLRIQHRYVSEWQLTIENVVADDEGEYSCKTNANFYKTVNLQVQSKLKYI
jgi:hypothetical protein